MRENTERQRASVDLLYRELPSVNELLLMEPVQRLLSTCSHDVVVRECRASLEEIRRAIAAGTESQETVSARIGALPSAMVERIRSIRYSLRPVVNATGVLLHTNLGRAPLSRKAVDHIAEVACGYSNLEFDLDTGTRGKRDVHVEASLLALMEHTSGIKAPMEMYGATVVNNCAAATFLALHALVQGREVLVSRGELIEIGGGFRIPEILRESGAILREVGTTNRTRVADYESAISPQTGLILRVHLSNFRIEGFVERPTLDELVALGRRSSLPVFEDQGTGLIHSIEPFWITGEPTFTASFRAECDLIAASGDKLFGGPQCGILLGRRAIIDQIRRDPLFRTYRVDKLCYAALEATLHHYLSATPDEIPVMKMMSIPAQEIAPRCARLAEGIVNKGFTAEVVEAESVLGGGSAPSTRVKSFALSLQHASLTAVALLTTLRRLDPPIIGRIEGDQILLDLRTVEPQYDSYLLEAINSMAEDPFRAGQS